MSKKIFISADHGMAIAGLKPHAQYMEAHRADYASPLERTSTN
ncbi:MAG TPA: hypothetical protein VF918_07060 [Anaerolineales bacterium]